VDLNLPAFKFSPANPAEPVIVERIPIRESIARAQDRQSIVEFDIRCHSAKALCALHRNKQSGRWMVA
jgi:hypothetical protein